MLNYLATLIIAACLGNSAQGADEANTTSTVTSARNYTVAIYYWPNFHRDAYHQSKKGDGWTEWEIVKNGKPECEGRYQPKVPLWGYRDESTPGRFDSLSNLAPSVLKGTPPLPSQPVVLEKRQRSW